MSFFEYCQIVKTGLKVSWSLLYFCLFWDIYYIGWYCCLFTSCDRKNCWKGNDWPNCWDIGYEICCGIESYFEDGWDWWGRYIYRDQFNRPRYNCFTIVCYSRVWNSMTLNYYICSSSSILSSNFCIWRWLPLDSLL